MDRVPTVAGTANLIDILDRVLDKGLVVAGDIRVSLANVELLTIRIRLLVCSVDKAEQIGLNWWRFDPNLTGGAQALPAAVETKVETKRVTTVAPAPPRRRRGRKSRKSRTSRKRKR